jgi:hypothetical protein
MDGPECEPRRCSGNREPVEMVLGGRLAAQRPVVNRIGYVYYRRFGADAGMFDMSAVLRGDR